MTRKQAVITLIVTALVYVGLYQWGLRSFPDDPFVTYNLALIFTLIPPILWVGVDAGGRFMGLSLIKKWSFFHYIRSAIFALLGRPLEWITHRVWKHGWRSVLEGLLRPERERTAPEQPVRNQKMAQQRKSVSMSRRVRALIGNGKEEGR